MNTQRDRENLGADEEIKKKKKLYEAKHPENKATTTTAESEACTQSHMDKDFIQL